MIPFDFEYYRPDSIKTAVDMFKNLARDNKQPLYYGGGTEIISMARMNNIFTGAVLDIKEIPELKVLELQEEYLVIGAGVTLTQIHEANIFPLLAQASARVADHTIQNKITLGGNICGTIIYRETLLPLLLTDCDVVVASEGNNQIIAISDIFDQTLRINPGDLLVQIRIAKKYLSCPYVHVKRTKEDKINYPLLTICALKADNKVRMALSGLANFPFRSLEMEEVLNNRSLAVEERVHESINIIPAVVLDDQEGSADYRRFILGNLLTSIVNELEADNAQSS